MQPETAAKLAQADKTMEIEWNKYSWAGIPDIENIEWV